MPCYHIHAMLLFAWLGFHSCFSSAASNFKANDITGGDSKFNSKTIIFAGTPTSAENGTTTAVAISNAALLNQTLSPKYLPPGSTLIIPNSSFLFMGGVVSIGLKHCTIRLEGTLKLSDDIKAYPLSPGKHGKASSMPRIAIRIINSTDLLITSSGTGTIDGQGAKWWGIPGVGYLERGKNRPPLFSMEFAVDFIIEHILFYQAPRFNFISTYLRNATIRFCQVYAARDNKDSHTGVDLTAFNTDGFDISGENIHVYNSSVWNDDDTFCIKANGGDTQNVLVENVHASGVGLSIGGISNHKVNNVTFRNVVMHHTAKGIYIKLTAGASKGGQVTNVTYENIIINKPSSWPIWIGPAQQDIKEEGQKYNPCHGDPCSLCWPAVKTANCDAPNGTITNITLRNVTILNPSGSPGVIFGNATRPITNILFDGGFTRPLAVTKTVKTLRIAIHRVILAAMGGAAAVVLTATMIKNLMFVKMAAIVGVILTPLAKGIVTPALDVRNPVELAIIALTALYVLYRHLAKLAQQALLRQRLHHLNVKNVILENTVHNKARHLAKLAQQALLRQHLYHLNVKNVILENTVHNKARHLAKLAQQALLRQHLHHLNVKNVILENTVHNKARHLAKLAQQALLRQHLHHLNVKNVILENTVHNKARHLAKLAQQALLRQHLHHLNVKN
eukprot:UC4_evm1s51